MFKCLDYVMHPGMGVCKIKEIKKQSVFKNQEREFYVLRPVYENEKTLIYVPVDSDKIKLRKLLTREDIKAIISALPNCETAWIENEQQRKEAYMRTLKSGDHVAIMGIIKVLYEQRLAKQECGKKLYLSDEKLLNEAERLIHQELAFTMEIKPHEVADFILGELNSLK